MREDMPTNCDDRNDIFYVLLKILEKKNNDEHDLA